MTRISSARAVPLSRPLRPTTCRLADTARSRGGVRRTGTKHEASCHTAVMPCIRQVTATVRRISAERSAVSDLSILVKAKVLGSGYDGGCRHNVPISGTIVLAARSQRRISERRPVSGVRLRHDPALGCHGPAHNHTAPIRSTVALFATLLLTLF